MTRLLRGLDLTEFTLPILSTRPLLSNVPFEPVHLILYLSLLQKNLRRSPSVGKESSTKALETAHGDVVPKEFQFDNYEEVEMDVSEMEESPSESGNLCPLNEACARNTDWCLTPLIQVNGIIGLRHTCM